jgi:non-heme chloroperoxidase
MTPWADDCATRFQAFSRFDIGDWRLTANAETPASFTEREMRQIERANAIHRQPVLFVRGLWPLDAHWDHWTELFEAAGYATLTPSWPTNSPQGADWDCERLSDETVEQVTNHFAGVAAVLHRSPAIVGHSLGALFARNLADRGLSVATVAIDPAPPEALFYSTYSAHAFQSAAADFNPQADARLDTSDPERGPLLNLTVQDGPQRRHPGLTKLAGLCELGLGSTIDQTWDDVAIAALDFIQRFTS